MRIEVWVYDDRSQIKRCSVFTDWRNALHCLANEHADYRWSIHTAIRPDAVQLVIQP